MFHKETLRDNLLQVVPEVHVRIPEVSCPILLDQFPLLFYASPTWNLRVG